MERSVGPAGGLARPDDCPDAQVQEAADRGRRPEGAVQSAPSAWDAWVAVLPDASGDEAHPLRAALADEDVGKSADLARDVPVQDAWLLARPLAPSVQRDAEAELCKRAEGRSAERSSEALAAVASKVAGEPPQPEARPVSQQPAGLAERQRSSRMARLQPAAAPPCLRAQAVRLDALVSRSEAWELQSAFRLAQTRPAAPA